MKNVSLILLLVTVLCISTVAIAVPATVTSEGIARLGKGILPYAVQNEAHTEIGWGNPGAGYIYTAVSRFDLSDYTGMQASGDATLSFYASVRLNHAGDPYGYQVRELNKSFEFYSTDGWQQGGLNWDYRNSNLDPWTQGDTAGDAYYFDKGGLWDTSGQLGTFSLGTDTNPGVYEYELVTITISQATMQNWLDGNHNGILFASANLLSWQGYKEATIAGNDSGYAVPTLSFEAVPEPATLVLLGIGGMVLRKKRV